MRKSVVCPKCGGTGLCVVMLPPLGLTHVICDVCCGNGYIEEKHGCKGTKTCLCSATINRREVKSRESKKTREDFVNRDNSDDSCSRVERPRWNRLKTAVKSLCQYVNAGLTSAGIFIFIFHPWLLMSALIALNQIGNLRLNYALLAIFVIDAAAAFLGGIYMEAKKEGLF